MCDAESPEWVMAQASGCGEEVSEHSLGAVRMQRPLSTLALGVPLSVVLAAAVWWTSGHHPVVPARLTSGQVEHAPAAAETIPLSPGCNNVALTWPAGTPLHRVAAAVREPQSLIAIWSYRPDLGQYAGFSPVRGQPVDYASIQSRLEPAFVCVRAAGVLARPAAGAQDAPLAERFTTLPAGWLLPSGAECAALVRRSNWEPRPDNTRANQTTGISGSLLPAWVNDDPQANTVMRPRIDGNFTGTTDEIIQWGACKWGVDEDIVRAMAVQESRWRQSGTGDITTDAGRCQTLGLQPPCHQSYGLLQVKSSINPGAWPHVRDSTAFNVDYTLAVLRACFEGYELWLAHRVPAPGYSTYQSNDLWGCIGRWFSGGWYDPPAIDYIGKVRRHLADGTWTASGF
jgi:autotransporter family porin